MHLHRQGMAEGQQGSPSPERDHRPAAPARRPGSRPHRQPATGGRPSNGGTSTRRSPSRHPWRNTEYLTRAAASQHKVARTGAPRYARYYSTRQHKDPLLSGKGLRPALTW